MDTSPPNGSDDNSTNADHDIQIRQITPTTGAWLAVFDDDTARPVVCLALIQCVTHNKGYVAPMVSGDSGIVDATMLEGYIEIIPEEDDDGMEQIFDGDEDENAPPLNS